MALARVVSFDGVSADQMEKRAREIEERESPEGLPATEVVLLHNGEDDTALAILFFETEHDYRLGDATLNAMPAEDTPGRRGSVTKYNVALRMTV